MLIIETVFGALLHVRHVLILLHIGYLRLSRFIELLEFRIQEHLIGLSLPSNLTCSYLAYLLSLNSLLSSRSSLLWLSRIVLLLYIDLTRIVLHHLLVLHRVQLLLILHKRLATSIFDNCIAIWSHADAALNLLKVVLLI